MGDRLITVSGLRVSFMTAAGEIQAVRGVDFHLDRGETLAIVGESGCGKSVTVQTVMRLNQEPPAVIKSGSIRYTNGDLDLSIERLTDRQMRAYRGREFSMIFQDAMTSLNPTARAGNQIVEGILRHQSVSRAQARQAAVRLLEQTGLPNPEEVFRRYPHTMSGGQRQRVMIAMALSCNPAVLFADEPTTALDVTIQAKILEEIKEIKKRQHLSVIFITHDLGVVANMADRICVMYAGKIVEVGTAQEIFYSPAHPYTWALLSSMPDLETKERLFSIPGTPPNMIFPPKGDAFAERNQYALAVDFEEQPPFFKLSDTHYAATWLLHPNAPKVEMPEALRHRIERMRRKEGA